MTLLVVLKSGHADHIEEFKTHGLASQAVRSYTDSGVVCRIVPDELREDITYLMGQVQEQREQGFIEERRAIPNGRGKKEGARGFGRMIFPAFGGMLERESIATPPEALSMGLPVSPPLTFSSTKARITPENDDLIILGHE